MGKKLVMILCLLAFFNINDFAQTKSIIPDLSVKDNLRSAGRQFIIVKDKMNRPAIHLDSSAGPGVVWIKELSFSTGTIEFDVKGKDVLQESFVGIAFNSLNDSTYEAVYFRPFNFQSTDPVRKKHAVQYIALPKYDWFYLRETYPDKYEHALLSVVNPNDWFHVKVVIDRNKIQAFVNSEATACLTVQPIVPTIVGKMGFWVGNGSDGDFANLSVTTE